MELQKLRLANGKVRKVTPAVARTLLQTGNYEDLGTEHVQPRKHAREASAQTNTQADAEASAAPESNADAGANAEPSAEPKAEPRTEPRKRRKAEEGS